MAPDNNEFEWSPEVQDGLLTAIPTLLASLAGMVNEFELLSFALQRTDYGDFRVILRGYANGGPNVNIGVVAFTNARTPSECTLRAEHAFASGNIKWKLDKWAANAPEDGSPKDKQLRLTIEGGAIF